MKLLKIFLVLFLSIITFSGCIKVDTKVKINKDGSGTIEEQVLMSEAVVKMMSEFMSSFQDSSSAPEGFNLFKEEELKDKASEFGNGVKYVSGKEVTKDGWQGYKVIYSFKDLNQIKMATDPNEKMEMGDSEAGEYFSFKFKPGNVAELILDRPEAEFEMADEDFESDEEMPNEQLDDKFLKMMDGMGVKIVLSFKGDIVETNATYVDDSNITLMDLDFSELLKNKKSMEMLKKNPPSNMDEMKKIVEDIPGIKMEIQKPVFIKFK